MDSLGKIISLPSRGDANSRYGVLVDNTDKPIAIKAQNISTSKHIPKKITTDELRRQYDDHYSLTELDRRETMNADQLALMRTMMNMFMTEEKEIEIFGRKIEKMPNYHEKMKSLGFPYKVDPRFANDYLRVSYEQNQGLPQMMELYLKNPEYKPSPKDILKRLHTNHPEKLSWYFGARDESMKIFTLQLVTPYASFIRHSFSNQSYRKEVLCRGTTHVAIGFVDLGMLFAADLRSSPSFDQGPLKFLGIEKSAYAIAKALVIWGLIDKAASSRKPKNKSHVHGIVQAWFSSTWDNDTAESVQDVLASLTSSAASRNLHPDVLNILCFWKESALISVEDARASIVKATSESQSEIGRMKREKDRTAVAQYELTKDFGLQGIPVYGNLLMFSCPDGVPPLAKDESVFSAFNFKDVMDILLRNEKGTILDAAKDYAYSNIEKLIHWVQCDQIELELHCADIKDSIDFVASQKPWTMSWSNVLDYFDHKVFHDLARECSIHGDTIHFGYSMNWTANVLGTNIIDYPSSQGRSTLIELSNTNAAYWYESFAWDKYFRLPLPQNPINTVSNYALEHMHYKDWCKYFFDIGRVDGPCNVGNIEHSVGSPLSTTGSSTIYFTWTYDPDIKFNNIDW